VSAERLKAIAMETSQEMKETEGADFKAIKKLI
jgi:hypothetical protein